MRAEKRLHSVMLDFIVDHKLPYAAVVAGFLGLLAAWLKRRASRRIEIERPGLKVKVQTVQELERALKALGDYDDQIKVSESSSKQRR